MDPSTPVTWTCESCRSIAKRVPPVIKNLYCPIKRKKDKEATTTLREVTFKVIGNTISAQLQHGTVSMETSYEEESTKTENESGLVSECSKSEEKQFEMFEKGVKPLKAKKDNPTMSTTSLKGKEENVEQMPSSVVKEVSASAKSKSKVGPNQMLISAFLTKPNP